ncbi:hypothetical protein NIES2098_10560 [Calothrix sp. NIES-2098]|nr:hypothetical protein NIES2098_10560 [Calothrix sp. NIES-2098]
MPTSQYIVSNFLINFRDAIYRVSQLKLIQIVILTTQKKFKA